MPLLLPIIGLFGITFAVIGGENLAKKLTGDTGVEGGTGQNPANHAVIPGWVIPTALVVVGGVLLYKKGAKILHV